MINLAVIYYSSTGNTHLLAETAATAAEKAGAAVRLRKIVELVAEPPTTDPEAWAQHTQATHHVPEASLEDLEWADAILFGTPVRFGLPAPALMHFIDTTAQLSIAGGLAAKTVSAFASGSAPHGGQVSTILALHNTFCHWGSVIVANGSTDEVLFLPTNGSPYGTANVSRNQPGNVTDENLAAIEFQTRRVVEVATLLNAGRASAV